MEQAKIDRINALARKAKTPEGLTEAEKHERALLRREYLDAVKANLESQLEHTYLQRPDGTWLAARSRLFDVVLGVGLAAALLLLSPYVNLPRIV